MPRVVGGLASLAAVALVAVLVGLPLTARPPASEAPTAAASGVLGATGPPASPNASPLPEARVLTAAELGSLVEARGSELAGLMVAVEGELALDPSVLCLAGTICGKTILAGAGASFVVKPVGDIGPGPWAGSGPKAGTFALRLTDSRDATGERLIVEYLGDILPAADRLAWSVDDLAAGEAREGGGRDWAVFKGYVAVRGWLVRTPLRSCPSIARAPANGRGRVRAGLRLPDRRLADVGPIPAASGRRVFDRPRGRDQHAERDLR